MKENKLDYMIDTFTDKKKTVDRVDRQTDRQAGVLKDRQASRRIDKDNMK